MFISLLSISLLCFACPLHGVSDFHPIGKVNTWIRDENRRRDVHLPFVATLSTVGPGVRPYSYPIEITKISRKDGIFFFTKNDTQTVKHLNFNPFVTLGIYLPKTRKQIFISGKIEAASSEILENTWKKMSRLRQSTFFNTEIAPGDGKSRAAMPNTFLGYHLTADQMFFYTNAAGKVSKKEQFKLENNGCWLEYQLGL